MLFLIKGRNPRLDQVYPVPKQWQSRATSVCVAVPVHSHHGCSCWRTAPILHGKTRFNPWKRLSVPINFSTLQTFASIICCLSHVTWFQQPHPRALYGQLFKVRQSPMCSIPPCASPLQVGQRGRADPAPLICALKEPSNSIISWALHKLELKDDIGLFNFTFGDIWHGFS